MVISGSIENVIYRNSENGYTVVEIASGFSKVIATGKFPVIGIGERLELTGEFKINKQYYVYYKQE